MAWIYALLMALGCGSGRSEQAPALAAVELTLDALAGPRGDEPFIAGETVRVGLRIRGGTPPYRGTLRALRQDRPAGTGKAPPPQNLSATHPIDLQLDPAIIPELAGPGSGALELALQSGLAARAPSGTYRLSATIDDARGRTAQAITRDWQLIGDDAPSLPAQAPSTAPAHVVIHDVAGRRRKGFVRGEAVTARALLPGARTAEVAIIDPGGAKLAQGAQRISPAGIMIMPFPIPRLARPGSYGIAIRTDNGLQVLEIMEVIGTPATPAERLVVDAMAIYGGADRRALRSGYFRRGESIDVEMRVGGGKVQVTGIMRLHGPRGIAGQHSLGRADIADPAPDARIFIRGSWQIPAATRPGRYRLEVEASEGEHVSSRSREILVD